jgi:hypothetical protein
MPQALGKAARMSHVTVVNTFAGGTLNRHNNSRRHGHKWLDRIHADKGTGLH